MAGEKTYRSMEETATWTVAVVCFVLIVISLLIETALHRLGHWLQKRNKNALNQALENIKSELMLLGFISLLLTVLQSSITSICVPSHVAATWRPCIKISKVDPNDKCTIKDPNKVALMTTEAIHELHIFIFVLALTHVLHCITTLALGRLKMRTWRSWEEEATSVDHQYMNDQARFRFTRETSFGKRHLRFWSKSPISLRIVCFFRQFIAPVTKIDYLTLRHGFINAHLPPGSEAFDFRKYINRSLEEDFKNVVGISPLMWFFSCLFLLTYTKGWYSFYWTPFIPFIIILMAGTRLEMIITRMGLRIQDRANVVQGTPVVQLGDDLFWFNNPRFMLSLIHFSLFQNAFQLAFLAFTWYKYDYKCFHKYKQDVIIRATMGVIVHILCSYVTLPLYALVTQMGSTLKPTVFSEKVARALKDWHHSARKPSKHGHKSSEGFSSRPSTPSRNSSPVHLLHRFQPHQDDDMIHNANGVDNDSSVHTTPRSPDVYENDYWANHDDIGQEAILPSTPAHLSHIQVPVRDLVMLRTESESTLANRSRTPASVAIQHQHEIEINDFSFQKSSR